MAKAKKASRVLLTPERLQELKDAIIAGESTKSIHQRLGISVANIGYHKGELKKKGLRIGGSLSASKGSTKAKVTSKASITPKEVSKQSALKLIVNGVSVYIEGTGSVSVGEDYIRVDY